MLASSSIACAGRHSKRPFQVFPMRIVVGGVCLLLLLWLLFSSSPDNNFYGIMLDAGSTG